MKLLGSIRMWSHSIVMMLMCLYEELEPIHEFKNWFQAITNKDPSALTECILPKAVSKQFGKFICIKIR